MASGARRQRKERFLGIMAEPEALDKICERMSDGETLIDIARGWDVLYSRLYQWLHDDSYPERLQKYAKALEARNLYYTEWVRGELMRTAQAQIADCFDAKGNLLPIRKMPSLVRASIKSIEVMTNDRGDKVHKLHLLDRLRTVEMIGKHARMFAEPGDKKGADDDVVPTPVSVTINYKDARKQTTIKES